MRKAVFRLLDVKLTDKTDQIFFNLVGLVGNLVGLVGNLVGLVGDVLAKSSLGFRQSTMAP